MVISEAMACRTPVITWPNASVLRGGSRRRDGFIAESVEEVAAAVDGLGALEPGTLPGQALPPPRPSTSKTADHPLSHPLITAQSLRQARTAPYPSCQPAVSDRAQAQANHEGTAATQANRQPSLLLVSVGVLAVVTLVAVLAALAVRRARRRAPRPAASLSR